jgi:hypothetical protein
MGVACPTRLLMKRTEIILRQDRIVYILLVVTATIGLTWVLWRHQHLLTQGGQAAPAALPTATTPR